MENKGKKITNKSQFEALVHFMERNPAIARGATQSHDKENFKRKMKELENILNSLGPPTRECKEWEKVWRDYKQKIKKKVSHNKKEIRSTGGGLCKIMPISTIEENVISLLNYDKLVSSGTTAFGLEESEALNMSPIRTGIPQTNASSARTDMAETNASFARSGIPETNASSARTDTAETNASSASGIPETSVTSEVRSEVLTENLRRNRNTSQNKHTFNDVREKYLKQQTECLEKIKKNTSDIVYYLKKTNHTEEMKMKMQENYFKQKLCIKQNLLDCKLEKLGFQIRSHNMNQPQQEEKEVGEDEEEDQEDDDEEEDQ